MNGVLSMVDKTTVANANADTAQANAKAKQAEPSIANWLELISSEAGKLAQAGDFNAASKLFSAAAKLQSTQAQAEQQARIDAVADAKPKLVTAIQQAIADVLGDKAKLIDGVWIAWDKSTNDLSCSLFKPQTERKQRSSNGVAKKFNITNEQLLAKYGDEPSKFNGYTFQQAYASIDEIAAATGKHRKNVLDGGIRRPMLKLDKRL